MGKLGHRGLASAAITSSHPYLHREAPPTHLHASGVRWNRGWACPNAWHRIGGVLDSRNRLHAGHPLRVSVRPHVWVGGHHPPTPSSSPQHAPRLLDPSGRKEIPLTRHWNGPTRNGSAHDVCADLRPMHDHTTRLPYDATPIAPWGHPSGVFHLRWLHAVGLGGAVCLIGLLLHHHGGVVGHHARHGTGVHHHAARLVHADGVLRGLSVLGLVVLRLLLRRKARPGHHPDSGGIHPGHGSARAHGEGGVVRGSHWV